MKAAGEDSRLRLLALCVRQELSVSDLAEALRQSEPRVSRHLRILCEAGLLERLRQGQWVHYRLTRDAAAAAFVQGLLGQVDRKDGLFTKDQSRVVLHGGANAGIGGVASGRGGGVGAGVGGGGLGVTESRPGSSERAAESRLGRALKGFVEVVDAAVSGGGGQGAGEVAARGEAGRDRVTGLDAAEGMRRAGAADDVENARALVVGVEHLELLEAAAAAAGECVAIAHSRRGAQSARAFAERRGFVCRVLLAASSNALCEKDIEAAGAPFDVVYLDHMAAPDSPLDGMLKFGRRGLAAGGRLWLFERYESLESPRDKVVEHPIGRLRRMLGEVGLTCERLSPIEAEGEHVLAAVALPAKAASRGTGAVSAA